MAHHDFSWNILGPRSTILSESNPFGFAFTFGDVGITMGQSLSLPMIVLGLVLCFRSTRHRAKKHMIILRIFLYLVCVISIGWVFWFLVAANYKEINSVYQMVPYPIWYYGVSRLDIGLVSLNLKYIMKTGQKIEGFLERQK